MNISMKILTILMIVLSNLYFLIVVSTFFDLICVLYYSKLFNFKFRIKQVIPEENPLLDSEHS